MPEPRPIVPPTAPRRRLAALALLLVGAVAGIPAAPAMAQNALPTPESVLGARVGDDFFLATYEESMAYFERLAEASDRVQLATVGTTSFGREWKVAFVSSASNLARLEEVRRISQRLAHPEGLTDDEARRLAREGRAIVHIDGGLHATEVAHAQHTIQLAYDLASENEDPEILAILDQVVLLLWPSINPDGQTLVAEWYRSNLGTPYEVAPMPRLYQKYVGHDNNRDGYMLNTLESRVSTRVIRHWEPQILYNHHQTAPFPARIWIPPFAEPISEYVHPLMWRTVNLLGMSMAQALEERGQEGAVHMGTGFDNWYPGFMDHANNFHNVAAFLTETGLYRYATPHFYTVDDFPEGQRDLRPRSLYASPWEGGWWRLRDAVDYMLTASLSVLDVAAKYKEDVLYNRYQAGRDVIDHYRDNPPYAYLVPAEQRDPAAAAELLRRLAYNGIEIHRVAAPTTIEGRSPKLGTWVILMDQPFAHFVRQLFEIQSYPDLREYPEGPPDQPYDVAGWTLPLQMGVKVVEVATPLAAETRAALQPVGGEARSWDDPVEDAAPFDSVLGVGFDDHPVAAAIRPQPTAWPGDSGSAWEIDPAQNNAFRVLGGAWESGRRVEWKDGRYLVGELGDRAQEWLVEDLGLNARRTGERGRRLAAPRVGLYRPWDPSMDEGWTRWLFERYEIPFVGVRNADVLAGDLRDRFDVLVLVDLSPETIVEGFDKGSVPARYAGGLGRRGTRQIDAFVRAGGTLVALNRSTAYAIEELGLPVENVIDGLERTDFFLGGSIVEMIVDVRHPVMAGMPERANVFVDRSPVFGTLEGFAGRVLAKYPDHGSPLVSGYLLGEEHLQGWAGALEVEHGDGRVLLFGLRPQWRGQPFGTFKMLFNAALYTDQLAAATPDTSDFWTAPERTEEGEE